MTKIKTALIVGAGFGLSASLARRFNLEGVSVALASRNPSKLDNLCSEINASAFFCDATEADNAAALFTATDAYFGTPDVVIFNAGARVRGPIVDLDPQAVKETLLSSAYGAFLIAQQAADRMIKRGSGTMLFTGASASIKGYPQSAPFAMGKFALRGLTESLARELQPQNIHIAHFMIDGGIRNPGRTEPTDKPNSMLDPDEIAETYWQVAMQHRSAWSLEVNLRPWLETF